ncbi:MAG: sulfurtransferase TusA family protein [Deltaproteobacteria bacterium]|nr:sulfurtransferase TusA family protein [Deltaproteobacteria bacterium]
MTEQIHMEMDLHDSLQPLALLKVNQALRRMQVGDGLEIRGADPGTFRELLRLLTPARFTVTEARVEPTGYRIRLICRPAEHTHSTPAGRVPAETKGEQNDN